MVGWSIEGVAQDGVGTETLPSTLPATAATPADGMLADGMPPEEDARRTYLGRIVAQPMSHLGAPWLIRGNRQDEEDVAASYDQLRLTDGMVVVDLGCGNGFWTLPMARDVGPQGRVYAVDIQREMLQLLRERADRETIENVTPVLGEVNDPRLPDGVVDLLLMVDVYHEFSHPESMLWHIRRSLSPRGVVALLEYRGEDDAVPIKPLHKMTEAQARLEVEAAGFGFVENLDVLPQQHLLVFERPD